MKFIAIATLFSMMLVCEVSATIEPNCDDDISYPPCNINIEAVVSCPCPVEEGVRITLRTADGSLVKSKKEQVVPYFLFGDYKGNVRSARLEGKYTIQTYLEAIETPPVSFTMYPCVYYSP